MRRMALPLLVAAMMLGAVAAAGCGDTTDEDPTPVQTFKITPADPSQRTPTPAAETPQAGSPTAPSGSPTATDGEGTTIEIAGVNSTFDKEELTAPAGAITIVFDNQDSGVIHNIHFFKGSDARGEDVGETELEVGPVTQTLEMTLEPGEYFYQCDAHPTTMKGTLTVE